MPFVIHTDGMGWKREKWSELQKRYYRWSEAVAARHGAVTATLELIDRYLYPGQRT